MGEGAAFFFGMAAGVLLAGLLFSLAQPDKLGDGRLVYDKSVWVVEGKEARP